jgi:NADPH2:quinone reductase
MLACVCHQFGAPDTLVVEEMPIPEPAFGQVLVKIAAAGVNFADLLMVAGRYQVKPPFPFIPGLEFSGSVAALGAGVDSWHTGDRVMGAPAMGGCFAEYICMPADRLFAVPPEAEVSLELAAGLLIGHGTAAFSVMQRGQLKAGETVLVTGAGGGVGIAAVDIAKRQGAYVIATAGSIDKLNMALAHGADAVVNYTTENLRERLGELTEKRGVDLVIDMVGGAIFEDALRSTARWGRVVVVGFASGELPRVRAEYLLVKNLAVLGAGFGAALVGDMKTARTTVASLIAMNRSAAFRLQIADRKSLEDVPTALDLLASRKVVGKLLVLPTAHE